jgi:hypothetical protein
MWETQLDNIKMDFREIDNVDVKCVELTHKQRFKLL